MSSKSTSVMEVSLVDKSVNCSVSHNGSLVNFAVSNAKGNSVGDFKGCWVGWSDGLCVGMQKKEGPSQQLSFLL